MTDRDDRVDPATLVPEIQDWDDGNGVSLDAWINAVGGFALAIGYSCIFWPRFVRFGGYVLLEGFSEASLRGFEQGLKGDRRAVDAVMNHLHLAAIHCNAAVSEAPLRYLGQVMTEIYAAKLRADFPDLRFAVVFNDQPGLEPIDYQLTFWQVG